MENRSPATSILYQSARPAAAMAPGSLNLLGISFDGTACFRKGAAQGPAAIRLVSDSLETYSPYLDADLEEIAPFYDLGDIKADPDASVPAQWDELGRLFAEMSREMDRDSRILTLGGEHSISLLPISRYLTLFPELILLHLDAHADLRDGYLGFPFSHAAVIRRCLDLFGPGHGLRQYGIRSGTREEYALMREHKSRLDCLEDLIDYIKTLPADLPIYLSLDLDFFDPAFLPGTGTPEPGGETFASFITIISALRGRLVGADVVELAPEIDPTGNSMVFAAKIVREIILAFHGEDGHVR